MRRGLIGAVVVAGVIVGLAALAVYGDTAAVTAATKRGAVRAHGLSRVQKLKKALRACKKDRKRRERKVCRRKAARRYSAHKVTRPLTEAASGATTGTGGATTGAGSATTGTGSGATGAGGAATETTGTGTGTTTGNGGPAAEPLPSGISVITFQLTEETTGPEVEKSRRVVNAGAITAVQSVTEVIALINSEKELPANFPVSCPPLSTGTRLVTVELQFRDSREGAPAVTAKASNPSCGGFMSVALGANETTRPGGYSLVALVERVGAGAGTTGESKPAPGSGKSTGPVETPKELTPAEAERQAAAEAHAQDLLGELELPEGATEVASNPVGTGWLDGAAGVPATGNLVDRHHWWTAPGEPRAVESFIEAHPPAGSQRWLTGESSGPAGVDLVLGYRWPSEGALQSPTLTIQLVALPEGRTGVRADGMVVWLAPFPPADVIPPSAQVLELAVTRHHETTASVTVTEAAKVEAVAAMIESMPQSPGVTCHGPEPAAEAIFTFRAAVGGAALAVASVPDLAEVEPGSCLPMTLSLPESGGAAVLEDGPFIREVQDLLGVKIQTLTE